MKHLLLVIAVLYVGYTFLPVAQPPVDPVGKALVSASRADKEKIAQFYEAMADVVERDAGQRIPTLKVWRDMHQDALGLAFGGTELVGKYPGLDVAIDGELVEAVGLDNVAFGQVSSKLAAACREIAANAR